MSSLKDSIALLESDLVAEPPRINVYHDLPFAIMRYDPSDEWKLRWEIKLLTTRLESFGREVHVDLSPILRQMVKAHFSLNGELSHGVVTQAVHAGI